VSDLSIDDIRSRTAGCALGRDLRYLPVVDSTNRVAADLPPGQWSTGTVVLADYQAAGRGRAGRTWVAPPGTSVMLSVIFARQNHISPADYVMMAALAARDAINATTQIDVRLKWPNDLLAGNLKVGGILGELSMQNGVHRVILGMGINVNFGDSALTVLPDTATSLDLLAGHPIEREKVAGGLIGCLDLWYRGLTHRPDDIFDAWAAALDTVGLPVSVQDSGTTWNGIALGVQRDGGLLVETNDGSVRSVHAGDVSIRHPRDYTGQ
jgi:BirA family transcriptional regulator, biotin operon repressor / biotin---[acetyl-CoA-carboxylase] ligase